MKRGDEKNAGGERGRPAEAKEGGRFGDQRTKYKYRETFWLGRLSFLSLFPLSFLPLSLDFVPPTFPDSVSHMTHCNMWNEFQINGNV